jgi:hypothetical protein
MSDRVYRIDKIKSLAHHFPRTPDNHMWDPGFVEYVPDESDKPVRNDDTCDKCLTKYTENTLGVYLNSFEYCTSTFPSLFKILTEDMDYRTYHMEYLYKYLGYQASWGSKYDGDVFMVVNNSNIKHKLLCDNCVDHMLYIGELIVFQVEGGYSVHKYCMYNNKHTYDLRCHFCHLGGAQEYYKEKFSDNYAHFCCHKYDYDNNCVYKEQLGKSKHHIKKYDVIGDLKSIIHTNLNNCCSVILDWENLFKEHNNLPLMCDSCVSKFICNNHIKPVNPQKSVTNYLDMKIICH